MNPAKEAALAGVHSSSVFTFISRPRGSSDGSRGATFCSFTIVMAGEGGRGGGLAAAFS